MSDNRTLLIGGPVDGESIGRKASGGLIALPLDQHLRPVKDGSTPYAYAIHRPEPPNFQRATFVKVQCDIPDPTFFVPFVGGPLEGIKKFSYPIQYDSKPFQILLAKEEVGDQVDLIGSIAEYSPARVNGEWKMQFVSIVRDETEIDKVQAAIAEHGIGRELSQYTTEQLIEALLARNGFMGVIVMAPEEVLTTDWRLPAGAPMLIRHPLRISNDNIKVLLTSAVNALK